MLAQAFLLVLLGVTVSSAPVQVNKIRDTQLTKCVTIIRIRILFM